jgi:hypothetical protein
MSEERGQFFSSMFAGMVLGLLAAPINVIKVPLQVNVLFSFLFFFVPLASPALPRSRATHRACRVCRACVACVACAQSGVNANFTVRQICGDVYRERGLLGFYRGGLGIVLRDTVRPPPPNSMRTTRHDTTRHDTTRHDTTRHDTTRHDTTRHDTRAI